ncbi:MAG: hypothetical protein ACFB14_25150 [Leptolyngbyaceae cyanobacterium]
MNILRWLANSFEYLFGASVRIFGPNDDAYPTVGVQPYEGEPHSSRSV